MGRFGNDSKSFYMISLSCLRLMAECRYLGGSFTGARDNSDTPKTPIGAISGTASRLCELAASMRDFPRLPSSETVTVSRPNHTITRLNRAESMEL